MQNIIDDIYYIIYNIRDPEIPQTLGQLEVIQKEFINVEGSRITIYWKPTVKHCSFALQIALSIRVKLSQELLNYKSYKIHIIVKDNLHNQKSQIDKQVNDKERYLAAMENEYLMNFINQLIY
ncbi:unnamed protein product (macronuclear) [Paramecium tetraurelia]|uniref:Uncharacterized protein n=1 Tax=Paramecium tetraurelia TaxID=5888 RepID=A0CW13_PARTE|nr:uncharacterized protein GSPATT00001182001 [Paramecium tetraurelia]CAK74980.1 unnamed protein product [Paramecium tetraurelia]|eukprot:XP_001442377.1 hypothetical protein (macronuclear) [Paramecium tetraurelia strain d4-2]